MLRIEVPASSEWDENNECFINTNACTLILEHSLLAISKWEAEYKKPFLNTENRTPQESLSYIKYMTITPNVDPNVYYIVIESRKLMDEINAYMNDKQTATFFNEEDKKTKNSAKAITSELIYYWMVAHRIPFECQKWHINRLLTLIRVCNEENKPPKKVKLNDVYARNARMNAARKQKYNIRG